MKIVALAAEPSVAAALNMMEDWEVLYSSDPDEAVAEIQGASVVLIGGGTDEGLELAEYVRSLPEDDSRIASIALARGEIDLSEQWQGAGRDTHYAISRFRFNDKATFLTALVPLIESDELRFREEFMDDSED